MTSKPGVAARTKPAGSAPSRPTTGLRPAASSTTNWLTSAGSRGSGSPRRSWPTRNRTPIIAPGSGENVVGTIHMSWAESVAGPRAMATISTPRRRNIDELNGCDITDLLISIRSRGFGIGDSSIPNPLVLVVNDSIVGLLVRAARWRGGRLRRNVEAAVPLEQTLVSRSQEREIWVVVLVVGLDAFGEARSRITRHDQADQHAVHI